MTQPDREKTQEIEIKDEPGMAERFQRGLQKALSTPPKRNKAASKKKAKTPERGND